MAITKITKPTEMSNGILSKGILYTKKKNHVPHQNE